MLSFVKEIWHEWRGLGQPLWSMVVAIGTIVPVLIGAAVWALPWLWAKFAWFGWLGVAAIVLATFLFLFLDWFLVAAGVHYCRAYYRAGDSVIDRDRSNVFLDRSNKSGSGGDGGQPV
jgi:hypothetical protein